MELCVTLALGLAAAAAAVPQLNSQRDALALTSAARHLSGRVQQVRAECIKRGTYAALVFVADQSDVRFAAFVDGNRNGVRTVDISRGLDQQVTPWERLGDHFAGVRFGIADGVTDPDSGAPISGSGLRLGGSDVLSFAPTGGATSGTLYLQGRSGRECAVRVLGATGRTRVLRYDRSAREWAGL